MADKAISELVSAEQIKAADMFVLEQDGSAKKLTGQVLLNWLTAAADGHGGVQSIDKTGSSGLVDTYTITLADQTKQTFIVTNGDKGDKGDNAYLWIKYASQEPTPSSHNMSDIPDDWIGVYSGNFSTAPTDYTQYTWFQYKGNKGDKGDPALIQDQAVAYQVSDSGTIIPSGSWNPSVPIVPQGKYLWTRSTINFNSGNPVVSYSVSRMGLDGSGAVSSVAGISPDPSGNVTLTAADVGALANTGGDLTGELKMNGQPISGLNNPTASTQAANKSYVDSTVSAAEANAKVYAEQLKQQATAMLTALGWSDSYQTVAVGGVTTTNDVFVSVPEEYYEAYTDAGIRCVEQITGQLKFFCDSIPSENITVGILILN